MARRRKIQHFGGCAVNIASTPSISVADSLSLRPAGSALTIEMLIRPGFTNKVNQYDVLVMKTTSAAWSDGYGVFVDATSSYLCFWINNYALGIQVPVAELRQVGWIHLVCIYDGAFLRVYVNGVQRGTPVAFSTPIVHSAAYLGIGAIFGAQAHATAFAEVRVYGRALSAADVDARYFEGRDDTSMRTGLAGQWRFSDIAGTTCADRSGNGNTATLASASMASGESPMLARGSVRNFVPNSDDFTLSSLSTCTVTPNVAASPVTGAVTADEVHITTNGGFCIQSALMQAGKTYLLSYWVKRAGASNQLFYIRSYDTVSTTYSAQLTATSAWQQFSLMFKSGATANGNVGIFDISNNVPDLIVAGAQLEEVYPGQTTPSPLVVTGAAPLASYGPREWRQNHLPYSDDLTKWAVQLGSATISAGTISGATSNLLLRQFTVNGTGATPGVVFRYEVELSADAPCTVPIMIADATDGTPTVQSSIPVTTSWVRWSVSMTTASPGVGLIGVYVGDGATFPTGRTVYVRRASLTQATSSSDFIPTNGAPANSSGAPRSKAA